VLVREKEKRKGWIVDGRRIVERISELELSDGRWRDTKKGETESKISLIQC